MTAWTQRPEDEHRLLSALLVVLPPQPDAQAGASSSGALDEAGPAGATSTVGQPPSQDRSLADIWSALGGELKPSLDVVVTAPIVVGPSAPYGPPVLAGPSIGLVGRPAAPSEVARRGRGSAAATRPPELEPLPDGAACRRDAGAKRRAACALRVRGAGVRDRR